jgi:hypothetical protein
MEKNSITTKRVFHHYTRWEDWRCGFYDSCSGAENDKKVELVLEMFNSEDLTREYMNRVINEWKYSCEQNLTNESMNKIAYIGQAACCIYGGVPNGTTMQAWSMLSKDVRDRSDGIAREVINTWKRRNKNIQLCLNID